MIEIKWNLVRGLEYTQSYDIFYFRVTVELYLCTHTLTVFHIARGCFTWMNISWMFAILFFFQQSELAEEITFETLKKAIGELVKLA